MRLLDLFCKAGGASMGYHRAGFEVVGVDIEPQPHYPFEFHQADALTVDLTGFDVVVASPPCQAYSRAEFLAKARNEEYPEHADLVEAVRAKLQAAGVPYVIENVVGAPLVSPVRLCGAMFGLHVYRHRLFESNLPLLRPEHRPHQDQTPSAGNGVSPKGFISVCGTGGVRGFTAAQVLSYWQWAMGIDWMDRAELAEAIPPAYTEFIGRQLLTYLGAGGEAGRVA